jgi:hypothetical protein
MESVTLGFKGDSIRRIGKIVFNPASNVTPERWAKDIEVQVSSEGADGPYRTVAFTTLKKAPGAQEFKFVPAEARFVRLMFRSNWGSDRAVALGEVEVYEAIGQGDAIGQIIAQMEGAVSELRRFRQTQFNTGSAGATTASNEPALSEATVQLIQSAGGGAGKLPTSAVNIAAAANGGQIVDFSSQFISEAGKGPDPDYTPRALLDGQILKPDGSGHGGLGQPGLRAGQAVRHARLPRRPHAPHLEGHPEPGERAV